MERHVHHGRQYVDRPAVHHPVCNGVEDIFQYQYHDDCCEESKILQEKRQGASYHVYDAVRRRHEGRPVVVLGDEHELHVVQERYCYYAERESRNRPVEETHGYGGYRRKLYSEPPQY